jgi:hypothetical protein
VFRAKFIDVQLRSNPTDGRYLAPNFGGKETRIRTKICENASLPITHKKPQERATVAFVIVIVIVIAVG